MKNIIFTAVVICISIMTQAQLPKGDRILAWQVDMAENNNYDSAYTYAQTACMESVHLFYTWSSLEDSTNVFNSTYMDATLSIADIYFPAYGTKVELQIAPLNTGAVEVPTDLLNTNFDDPVLINRFKILLDTLFSRIPNIELSALNIGNEHDINFGVDAAQYSAYKTFLDSVIPYAKQVYFNLHGTDLKVGTTFTHHSLTNPLTSALCQTVNASCDVITTTYYPLNPDFTMKAPSSVSGDFDDLVAIYSNPAKPIYFAECGYASSAVCNSSEALQAEFYENVFTAWDNHYDNIKYITLFKTTDWSQSDVDTLAAYYGLSNNNEFKEYLRTLGVRTYPGNGTDKMAYNTILCELDNRNWCAVDCPLLGTDQHSNGGHDSFRVYPNPVKHTLTANLPASGTISLVSQTGQVVLRTEGISGVNVLECSDISSGLYTIVIQSAKQRLTKQVLIIE